VNASTGAVAAGADIGMFMNLATGEVAYPEIQGNEIINPLTGAMYYSPELAGFPAGSTIMGGRYMYPDNINSMASQLMEHQYLQQDGIHSAA